MQEAHKSSRTHAQSPDNQQDQGTINATELPLQCIQRNNATANISSEDCLYVNVYAPAKAQNLPVLVWIHGGGWNRT